MRRSPAPLTDVLERDWQKMAVDLARTLGWTYYHTHRSHKSPTGFPDLVWCRERVIFAELKRETTQPTDDQRTWLQRLHAAHAEVYLLRPRHLDQLASVLSARGTVDRWTTAQREARALLLAELDRVLNPQAKEKAA